MKVAGFSADQFALKNELIDRILLGGTSIGLLVFLVSMVPFNEDVINVDFFVDIVGISILFSTYYWRNRISLKTKVNTICTFVFILAISDLFENGLHTPDYILFVLIPFFCVFIYDLTTTVIVYLLCFTVFILVGHLYHLGIISASSYNVEESSIYRWYDTFLLISLVTFVITLFLKRFNDRLFFLLNDLETKNHELEETKSVIEETLEERNVLLQEIHHRVKNNLAVVSGLLSLQAYNIEDPKSKMVLNKSTNRIMSIAKVHEMLYESKKFNKIPFNTYVEELSNIILSSMNEEDRSIAFKTNILVDEININHGVPLAIIFNELITNSVKYGFSEKEGNEIEITVEPQEDDIFVRYADNGKGIQNFKEATNRSLGFTLIHSLMEQMEAQYTYDTEHCFTLSFRFPYK